MKPVRFVIVGIAAAAGAVLALPSPPVGDPPPQAAPTPARKKRGRGYAADRVAAPPQESKPVFPSPSGPADDPPPSLPPEDQAASDPASKSEDSAHLPAVQGPVQKARSQVELRRWLRAASSRLERLESTALGRVSEERSELLAEAVEWWIWLERQPVPGSEGTPRRLQKALQTFLSRLFQNGDVRMGSSPSREG